MTGQPQVQGSPSAQAIETSVQVALRIRPIITESSKLGLNRVRQRAENEVLSLIDRASTPPLNHGAAGSQQQEQPQQVVVVPLQRHFTFDHIFGTGSSQEEVYQGSVKRMVDKFLEGYNVTIMAYGQTSSGKTYTMGTGAPSSDDRGSTSEEIYNEDLIDLLVKGDFRPPVTIREDAKGNIYWTGVQEIVVSSVEEVIHLLWFGSQNRQTHSTEMNEKSSRSHAIFSITLRQEKFVPTHPPPPQPQENSPAFRRAHSKTPSIGHLPLLGPNGVALPPGSSLSSPSSARPGTPTSSTPSSIPAPFVSGIVAPGSKLKRQSAMTADTLTASSSSSSLATANTDDLSLPEPEGEWVTLNSKFHFVDLAGSERLKRTSAIGDRAKEGISINAGLHALGNVISALGDPSKKASHVPYRDSKLTRLLQDSLGGNALALMIACVSPSELNLGETLNTLKYANRARNIKNSSSLNQEINMDNPEYLRSIIQKLKLEIKILKEKSAAAATGIVTNESSGTESFLAGRSLLNRHSTSPAEDSDRGLTPSPSPSRRLTHFTSRESISTDISHGYLDSVQEEDDRESQYSDESSSTRTVVLKNSNASSPGKTTKAITGVHTSSDGTVVTGVRPNTSAIPSSVQDSKSFQEFVEPVIEEYEKVISGLETHLAMTQAALNHSELILEEQQGRLDVVEDENRTLQQLQRQQHERILRSPSPTAEQQQLQKELEESLQRVQEQLKEAQERKSLGEKYILELEEKLAQEQATAQEQIQKALKEHDESIQKQQVQQQQQQQIHTPALSEASSEIKDLEVNALLERIQALEEQCQRHQKEVDAKTEALRQIQDTPGYDHENDENTNGQSALQELEAVKSTLEKELAAEKARHETMVTELGSLQKTAHHVRTDSALEDKDHFIRQLEIGVEFPKSAGILIGSDVRIKELETELSIARASEQELRIETSHLTEKLEQLQKEHTASLEMEEMLHLAVSDLEIRLKGSQETERQRLEELEQSLTRIQDLEERSTKAESEASQVVEELKGKLAEAKAAAEERLADELLELLEKMEKERAKVETLQSQVETHLEELASAHSRASELETDRNVIQEQWSTDKEKIFALEKQIEEHSAQVLEKAALIATLEGRVATHEGTLAMKLELEQELEDRVRDHGLALESKVAIIQELEQKVLNLETALQGTDEATNALVVKVQGDLSEALEQLTASQSKAQEHESALEELKEKIALLEAESLIADDNHSTRLEELAQEIQALQLKVKVAEADRDEAETTLEEAERRHQTVQDEIRALQNDIALNLATIELLQTKLAEAHSPPSSRPGSLSSAAALASGEDPMHMIQKLEKEKSRYRALVRENEKEIERLSQDLESLASEFSNAATAFEDAEEEMKLKITELESMLEEKNLLKPTNLSTTSLASSLASSYSTRHRDSTLQQSSAVTTASKAQLASLQAERDQALQSSEELSLIVAELNEKNHSLQERVLNLEREHESIKLQHVLERQQDGQATSHIRTFRDRTERLDRNGSPSPVGQIEDGTAERSLRHKSSTSSSEMGGGFRAEDTLATPRQSWSTASSVQPPVQTVSGTTASPVRPSGGRQESTIIQQAKHIKFLEERLSELQKVVDANGGSPVLMSSASNVGLGIQHKASDPEMSLQRPSLLAHRQSSDRISPALRLAPLTTTAVTPATPPPTAPLPPTPTAKSAHSHLTSGSGAPSSPRLSGVPTHIDASSPAGSPSIRPSRTGSLGGKTAIGQSSSSNLSEYASTNNTNNNNNNNGWTSPASSITSISAIGNSATTNASISAATAQALQGVEVNELRGVVDTLAHQVQALKVEQTMHQGKIHRLEAALAETEEKLRTSRADREAVIVERDQLSKELNQAREDLATTKTKADRDRQGLEGAVERERREKERAVETKAVMEARMEELMGRKSKFACF
ncbi:hypothetical protein BGZ83_011056 [Gryganskiella cystojenkinii]|nr:hypothetical protein BGZ83_011056 [Gryganskiella cystojenkinii]